METRNEIRKYSMNAESYQRLGSAWIGTKGGFLLGLAPGECQGVQFDQTPRQWGAWRAYFQERKIPIAFMDSKLKATAALKKDATNPHCYTVPTEWPHEFDSEATVQGDHLAGNMFMRNWRPEAPQLADKARREATIAAYKARIPFEPKRGKYEPEPEPHKPAFIDQDRLLESYERDMAEHFARKARAT